MRCLLLLLLAVGGYGNSDFIIGRQYEGCQSACGSVGRACVEYNEAVPSHGCAGIGPFHWTNDNECVPMVNATCQDFGADVGRRICKCGADISGTYFFGTGLSAGEITPKETVMFSHQIAAGKTGVMTHFWSTAPNGVEAATTIRYYVDNERTASIEFTPSMASGVGFNDNQAPRGTKWLGVGAGNGHGQAWWNNYRIPFYKNITVTIQRSGTKASGGFFMIVRGKLLDEAKPTAKLVLMKWQKDMVPPLTWVYAVSLSADNMTNLGAEGGFIFQHTLAVASGNENFLEGCYHAYSPFTVGFPGTVLSTGTEDYYDSGWYFNAGEFEFPVSGFTHRKMTTNHVTWSAYRFHEMDPLRFGKGGIRYAWRNGDEVSPTTGQKCYTQSGGHIVGNPTHSNVTAYTWVYLCLNNNCAASTPPWQW